MKHQIVMYWRNYITGEHIKVYLSSFDFQQSKINIHSIMQIATGNVHARLIFEQICALISIWSWNILGHIWQTWKDEFNVKLDRNV